MYPILLVHGIYDLPSRFNRMRRALMRAGFSTVYAMKIRPADASIAVEAMGAQVQAAVNQLLASSGAEKLDIVCYSMGALATRYYIQRLSGKNVVRRYVSISCPHHGTLMAYFHPSVGARQMRPGSDLLRDLNADSASWGEVEVHSFWTHLDLMVLPARSSVLDWANNRDFWVTLHPFMLLDDRVIKAVIEVLAKE